MYGFNLVSLDAKGRLAIPARYRSLLEEKEEKKIIVTKDPQYPSLKIYPESQWQKISKEIENLNSLDPISRNLQWVILGNAQVNDFDTSGRMLILISNELRSYAEIDGKKRICLVGMGKKFEIWDENNWHIRQRGGALSTEIIDVVMPEKIKSLSI
jgi:MraZ protein